jgi:hypothetical protein
MNGWIQKLQKLDEKNRRLEALVAEAVPHIRGAATLIYGSPAMGSGELYDRLLDWIKRAEEKC